MSLTLYTTTGKEALFVKRDVEDMAISPRNPTIEIQVDNKKTYQSIDGFGASFTDSAAFLVNQILGEAEKERLMTDLFCPKEGIGLSVVRNPMGASDYARFCYSYNDIPKGETDFDLKHFTIDHDREDIIPLMKRALGLNPRLKISGSPWSAPPWMKSSGHMQGGHLKAECYKVYADYFVKYIEAYAKEGLSIYSITPQNEPLYMPLHYPSMAMSQEEEGDFIKNYLYPAFCAKQIQTKIFCYDHNWDRPDYPLYVLDEAKEAVDGVAWHWYGGRPVSQSQVLAAYPHMEVHFTEGSGGSWIPEFEPAFTNLMVNCLESLRHGTKSFVLWNIALDEENGPFVPGFGESTCRGLVRIEQKTKALTYTIDYYGLAHFSKFIQPGAVRLETSSDKEVFASAFRNENGTIAFVVYNNADVEYNLHITLDDETIVQIGLPRKSVVSILK